jgi:hypothetical protein
MRSLWKVGFLALSLTACAGGQVRRSVARADADVVAEAPPVREGLDALGDARERKARATQSLEEARLLLSGVEAKLEMAAADVDAAEAEIRAARVARDGARRMAASERRAKAQRSVERRQLEHAWRRRDVEAREANLEATRREEAYRSAELELARVEVLHGQGAGESYTKSSFVEQRERLRAAWNEGAADAEKATRRAGEAYERFVAAGSEPGPS